MTWQLQEAKNKFSEVVESSISKGPQVITRRGLDTAVVISYYDFKRFTAPRSDLKELLKNSDLAALDLERDKSVQGRASA